MKFHLRGIKNNRKKIARKEIIREAYFGVFSKPTRAVMTLLGTSLGILALLTTYGLSQTASGQVVSKFDKLAATEVKVTAIKSSSFLSKSVSLSPLPFNSELRLEDLRGVKKAGSISKIYSQAIPIRTVAFDDPSLGGDIEGKFLAASPHYFDAALSTLSQGRLFDDGHSENADKVVVLGKEIADQLFINNLEQIPNVIIEEDTYAVIGIIQSSKRDSTLKNSIIIPEGTAKKYYGLKEPEKILISVDVGAAKLIAKQAKVVLNPNNPDSLSTSKPYEPESVKEGIASDLEGLLLALGVISLLIGAIGIANITLVSVLERTNEIGLRRALGATRKNIGTQFLCESALVGFLGGLLGVSLAQIVVVAVSWFKDWTPVLEPVAPVVGIALGLFVGTLAGIYPSFRAAKLEPVEALRA